MALQDLTPFPMTPFPKTNLAGIAMAVLAAVSLALTLVMSRLAYDNGSNALSVLFLRFTLFALVLALWRSLQGRSLRLPLRLLLASHGIGLIYVIGIGAYLSSVAYLPVSLAVLIFYTYPLITVLMASILDRRRPSVRDSVGFLAAFAGLSLALEVSFESLHPVGIGLTIIASVGMALSFVLSERTLKTTDTTVVTLHMSVTAMIAAATVTLTSGALALPTENSGWWILAAALATFVAGFLAMFGSIKMIGPVRSAMIMNLEPPATILLAIVILGEHMVLQQALGAALVLAAIILTQRQSV